MNEINNPFISDHSQNYIKKLFSMFVVWSALFVTGTPCLYLRVLFSFEYFFTKYLFTFHIQRLIYTEWALLKRTNRTARSLRCIRLVWITVLKRRSRLWIRLERIDNRSTIQLWRLRCWVVCLNSASRRIDCIVAICAIFEITHIIYSWLLWHKYVLLFADCALVILIIFNIDIDIFNFCLVSLVVFLLNNKCLHLWCRTAYRSKSESKKKKRPGWGLNSRSCD